MNKKFCGLIVMGLSEHMLSVSGSWLEDAR
jgi:hypothetical protein